MSDEARGARREGAEMTVMTKSEIEALLDGTTPDWCVYSEPEVGLPPSLFAGKIGQYGFGPIEPLQGHDLNLAAAAPDLARTALALHQQLADAKAAQALVLERAADEMKQRADHWSDEAIRETEENGNDFETARAVTKCATYSSVESFLRDLAPDDGVEALAALRAELDQWLDDRTKALDLVADTITRALKAEAEVSDLRARLAAELAEARKQVAGLREAADQAGKVAVMVKGGEGE